MFDFKQSDFSNPNWLATQAILDITKKFTDKTRMESVLDSFGVSHEESNYPSDSTSYLIADHTVYFQFDEDGKFVAMGAYE